MRAHLTVAPRHSAPWSDEPLAHGRGPELFRHWRQNYFTKSDLTTRVLKFSSLIEEIYLPIVPQIKPENCLTHNHKPITHHTHSRTESETHTTPGPPLPPSLPTHAMSDSINISESFLHPSLWLRYVILPAAHHTRMSSLREDVVADAGAEIRGVDVRVRN